MATVGFDQDAVLLDFIPAFLRALERTGGYVPGTFRPEAVGDWDFGKALGLPAELINETWASGFLTEELANAAAMPRGIEEVRRHVAAGDDVLLITARGCLPMEAASMGQRQADSLAWLGRMLPVSPEGRTYFVLDKLPVLREHGVGLMYEDSPSTALKLAEAGIKVVMPVYAYNAHVSHPNITRVEGWHSW